MFKPNENFILYSNEIWLYVEISYSSSRLRLLPQLFVKCKVFTLNKLSLNVKNKIALNIIYQRILSMHTFLVLPHYKNIVWKNYSCGGVI